MARTRSSKRTATETSSSSSSSEEPPTKKAKVTSNNTNKNNNDTSETKNDFNRETQYKFISWNVNGLRAMLKKREDFDQMMKEEKPDIICFQETKGSDDVIKKEKWETILSDYKASFNSCKTKKGYSGTAVFVRKDLNVKNITFDMGVEEHDKEGRMITVELPDVFLVGTYVPNAGQKLERLDYRTQEWDPELLKYLQNLEEEHDKPVVWCGDLNVAHKPIDIHAPKNNKKSAGFTIEERNRFQKIIDEGYIDTFRMLNPDKSGAYTYWGYRGGMRGKDKGWRLDYFVVSPSLKDKVVDSYILKHVMGSDHCPIGLILKKPSVTN